MLNRSRLHVGDIAPDVTEAELRTLFEQAGEIDAIMLPRADGGQHKGFAFIEMKTSEGAVTAIQRFNGFLFHTRILYVYSVPPRSTRRGDSKAELK